MNPKEFFLFQRGSERRPSLFSRRFCRGLHRASLWQFNFTKQEVDLVVDRCLIFPEGQKIIHREKVVSQRKI